MSRNPVDRSRAQRLTSARSLEDEFTVPDDTQFGPIPMWRPVPARGAQVSTVGETLAVASKTLNKRLRERRLLAATA